MSEAFVQHIKRFGFNAIALPSSQFKPLALPYEWHGRRGWLRDTEFASIFGAAAAPPVQGPDPEIDFSGKVVRDLEASATISVLSGLIGALGGGTLGLKGGFERASTITFSYGSVTSTYVSPSELEQRLRAAAVPSATGFGGKALGDHLFVATTVLRSREFSVQAQDSHGQNIGIDVPVIQNAIGAGVSVKRSEAAESTITFKGERDVAFAFQAWWIRLQDGVLALQPTKAGAIATKAMPFGEKPEASLDAGDDLVFDRTFPTDPRAAAGEEAPLGDALELEV